jgi:hypothetical protein
MSTVILIITEDSITTIPSVDSTMTLVVVTEDIILALLMEVSSIIQPLTDKVIIESEYFPTQTNDRMVRSRVRTAT